MASNHLISPNLFLTSHFKNTNLHELKPVFLKKTLGLDSLSPKDTLTHINDLIQLSSKHSDEITGEDLLLSEIKEIPCLVEPMFQQAGLACLAGSSDTGKSSVLRQLAISIVTGQTDFLGFKINSRYREVIYVSTEDLQRETAYLLSRQSRTYQPNQLKGLRFVFDTNNLLEKLESMLMRKRSDMIIIDCFADAYGSDLKDTQKIRTFLHRFQELAQKYDCLILFLHHTGKRTENFEPSKNNLLSGQGFEAKMRIVIELRIDPMNPNHRHWCIVKGNYLPARFKKESHILEFNEDTFTFTNTGERMPFELLVKQPDADASRGKYEQAKELKSQGQTYEQIAKTIGYNSKGSVTKLFDKAKKNGWDKEDSDKVS